MDGVVNTKWFEAVKAYWKIGFNVLPIGNEKRPIVEWVKWKTERQKWHDVESMPWHNAHGIAALSGTVSGGLVCVDIDKVTSSQVAISILGGLGLPFDYPWLVKSGSGAGYHLWLIAPDLNMEGKNRWDYPGVNEGHIDLRSNQHYTILPPSVHPTGNFYTFVNGEPQAPPARVNGALLVQIYKSVVAFPVEAAPALESIPKHKEMSPSRDDRKRYEQSYVHKALREECSQLNTAPSGQGSDYLYKSALRLSGYVKTGYLEYTDMENALLGTNAARRRPVKEALATIKSAFSIAQPRGIPDKNTGNGHDSGSGDLSQAPTEELPPLLNLTDWGNAQRLLHHFGNSILYCHDWEKWLHWDSTRWKMDRNGTIKRMAKTTVKRINLEVAHAVTDKQKEELRKWALRSESSGKLEAMLRVAESEYEVSATPEDFDADPWLLNCRNCIVDLRTGDTFTHEPGMRLMKQVSADYDPSAKAPVFEAFLNRIMDGNTALIDFIQRAVGYSITGSTSEQVAFFLHGGGSNGKSTLLNAIRFLLNDYAKNTPTSTLMRKQASPGGASDDLARLMGVRFVTASETDENQYLSESTIKALTGDDVITARHLYSGNFDFKPVLKIWLACNHKPVITGTDDGIWRRIRLIPFLVKIQPHEKDPDLPRKLENEAAGILNWAIQGCLKWRERDLKDMPKEVSAAVDSYRNEMDVISGFISDCCIVSPNVLAPASDLYIAFQKWANDMGEKVVSQKSFGSKLSERGFLPARGTGGKSIWRGIGIKASEG